jgi:hypothetical protein
MTSDKVCSINEGELPPIDTGRRVKASAGVRCAKVKKVRIMKRLRDGTGPSPELVRNRIILQEMRRLYDELTGVGDRLVDTRLSQIMSHRKGVGSLGKQDLCALNYDLAALASSIFGPVVAKKVYDRIGEVICQTFS